MNIKKFFSDNKAELMTGAAVGGTITTVTLAIRGTLKAAPVIDNWDDYSNKERFELLAPIYAPAALSFLLTVTCIVASNRMAASKYAALSTACSIAETALGEYQKQVIQRFGEKEADKIREDISNVRVANNPKEDSPIIITGKGEYLCYESYTGRYFMSDIESVRKAQNDFNAEVMDVGHADFNGWCYYLGIGPVPVGDIIGWNAYHKLDIKFMYKGDESGAPYLYIDYAENPRKEWII